MTTRSGCSLGSPDSLSVPRSGTPAAQAQRLLVDLGVEQLPAQGKADILMARGEYAAAITAYQQSDLKSAVVWNNIGMAYHHLFALEEARKAAGQLLDAIAAQLQSQFGD